MRWRFVIEIDVVGTEEEKDIVRDDLAKALQDYKTTHPTAKLGKLVILPIFREEVALT